MRYVGVHKISLSQRDAEYAYFTELERLLTTGTKRLTIAELRKNVWTYCRK